MLPGASGHSRAATERQLDSSQGQPDRSLVNRVGSSAVGLLRNTVWQPAASQMVSALASSSSAQGKGGSSSDHSDLTYEGISHGSTPQFQTCDKRDQAVPNPESFRTPQHNRVESAPCTQQEFYAFNTSRRVSLIPGSSPAQEPDENVRSKGIQRSSTMESKTTAQGIQSPMQAGTDRPYGSQLYLDRLPTYGEPVESCLQNYNKPASNCNVTNRTFQNHGLQLMLLEQQDEKRVSQSWQMNNGAVHGASNSWTSSDTDGQLVVDLLSGVNIDLEEIASDMSATQNSRNLESLFETPTDTESLVEYTTAEPPLPRVQRTSSSLNPSSLIPNFQLLKSHGTGRSRIPAATLKGKESLLSVYAAQALNGDIEPWHDILSRYHDEVWGDILPLVRKARKEMKDAYEGGGPLSNGAFAVRRLAMVLKHLEDPQRLEPTSGPVVLNSSSVGMGRR
ncbi:MAG: hypothetical protein Q9187_000430 [Circinaria calcarea]